jgi:hypothetical protein
MIYVDPQSKTAEDRVIFADLAIAIATVCGIVKQPKGRKTIRRPGVSGGG